MYTRVIAVLRNNEEMFCVTQGPTNSEEEMNELVRSAKIGLYNRMKTKVMISKPSGEISYDSIGQIAYLDDNAIDVIIVNLPIEWLIKKRKRKAVQLFKVFILFENYWTG